MKRTGNISRGSLRRLWGAVGSLARILGAEDAEEMTRDYVEEMTGQRSTRELSESQAERLIEWLEGRREQYRASDRDTGAVTLEQVATIRELEADLEWTGNAERLRGFCQRVIQRDWPWSSEEAAKVIEGLKHMMVRNFDEARFDRLMCRIDSRQLTAWEREFFEDVKGQIKRHGCPTRMGAVKKMLEIERKRRKEQ